MGLSAGLLSSAAVAEIAKHQVHHGSQSEVMLRLASIAKRDLREVAEVLSGTAVHDAERELSKRKLIWLALSWVRDQERDEQSAFEQIDRLYADLGYPSGMETFGPYAPAYQAKDDPVIQREAVKKEWERYLAAGDEVFGAGMRRKANTEEVSA